MAEIAVCNVQRCPTDNRWRYEDLPRNLHLARGVATKEHVTVRAPEEKTTLCALSRIYAPLIGPAQVRLQAHLGNLPSRRCKDELIGSRRIG